MPSNCIKVQSTAVKLARVTVHHSNLMMGQRVTQHYCRTCRAREGRSWQPAADIQDAGGAAAAGMHTR